MIVPVYRTINLMDSLSAQIIGELFRHLAVEDQQITRMISRHFARMITAQPTDFLVHAIKHNKQEFAVMAENAGHGFAPRICDIAAYYGRTGFLVCMTHRVYAKSKNTWHIYEAVRQGQHEIVNWLFEKWDERGMEYWFAAENDIQRNPGLIVPIVVAAAECGDIHLLTRLECDYRYKITRDFKHIHAEMGVKAALNGHMPILEVLYLTRSPSAYTCWGFGPNLELCAAAAVGGHLGVIIWLRTKLSNPCPWDGHTVLNALLNEHYHVARWVIENGCPYDPQTFPPAMRDRLAEMLANAPIKK